MKRINPVYFQIESIIQWMTMKDGQKNCQKKHMSVATKIFTTRQGNRSQQYPHRKTTFKMFATSTYPDRITFDNNLCNVQIQASSEAEIIATLQPKKVITHTSIEILKQNKVKHQKAEATETEHTMRFDVYVFTQQQISWAKLKVMMFTCIKKGLTAPEVIKLFRLFCLRPKTIYFFYQLNS